MVYELVKVIDNLCIKRTDSNGSEWWIPFNEANSDYQQYLVDTDGGLPLPEEQA